GIVPVYEVDSHLGRPYFSMAYVDGKSLAAVIQERPLTPPRAAEIARDVASAIAHAHANRIIHRDLKPANILIDSEGSPHITDFGVSKSLASQSALTAQGELIGTPHYMPPEQAGAPEATTGPPSDVYSIGAVLYASLTGRPPFQASSPIDVVAQLMTQEPVPPSRLMSGIPEDLETITMKCLSKLPKDRYPTAMALSEDLTCFLKGEPIAAKPPGLIKQIVHSIRRHVFLASVSGSFAFLLVVLTVLAGISLIRARARVTELTQLLEHERETARRFAYHVRQDGDHTVEHYELDRLTDAAMRLFDTDRQLAAHLAYRAATLAQGYSLEPPPALITLMREISEQEDSPELGLGQLIMSVEAQIERPLTDFEQAVYGLADGSPKMDAQSEDGSGQESTAKEPIDE
ncbi:MAG: serine/threonine-protein kinase, partial [Planctomycetota bacterium]